MKFMKTLQNVRTIISILPHCCSAGTESLFPLKNSDLVKSQNAKLKTRVVSKSFISDTLNALISVMLHLLHVIFKLGHSLVDLEKNCHVIVIPCEPVNMLDNFFHVINLH